MPTQRGLQQPVDLLSQQHPAQPAPGRLADLPRGQSDRPYVHGQQPIGWFKCGTTWWARGGSGDERWCSGGKIRFNAWYDFMYDTEAHRDHIACHEIGHSVGLNHGPSEESCMHAVTIGPGHLNQHHIDHLNAAY